MKAKRVDCDQCSNFIPFALKYENDLLSGIKTNAKCKLGKRVMFRKPKVTSMMTYDFGGYYRYCNEFNKKYKL